MARSHSGARSSAARRASTSISNAREAAARPAGCRAPLRWARRPADSVRPSKDQPRHGSSSISMGRRATAFRALQPVPARHRSASPAPRRRRLLVARQTSSPVGRTAGRALQSRAIAADRWCARALVPRPLPHPLADRPVAPAAPVAAQTRRTQRCSHRHRSSRGLLGLARGMTLVRAPHSRADSAARSKRRLAQDLATQKPGPRSRLARDGPRRPAARRGAVGAGAERPRRLFARSPARPRRLTHRHRRRPRRARSGRPGVAVTRRSPRSCSTSRCGSRSC